MYTEIAIDQTEEVEMQSETFEGLPILIRHEVSSCITLTGKLLKGSLRDTQDGYTVGTYRLYLHYSDAKKRIHEVKLSWILEGRYMLTKNGNEIISFKDPEEQKKKAIHPWLDSNTAMEPLAVRTRRIILDNLWELAEFSSGRAIHHWLRAIFKNR